MAMTEDGTTLALAKRIVQEWTEAHKLTYLAPRIAADLAERIERAIYDDRGERDG